MLYSTEEWSLFWTFTKPTTRCPLCEQILPVEQALLHSCIPMPCHCGVCCIEATYRRNQPDTYRSMKHTCWELRHKLRVQNYVFQWVNGQPRKCAPDEGLPRMETWPADEVLFLNTAQLRRMVPPTPEELAMEPNRKIVLATMAKCLRYECDDRNECRAAPVQAS